MTDEQLNNALALLDDAYILEAAPGNAHPRKRKNVFLLAACITVLLALSSSVLAATNWGTDLLNQFSGDAESGYEVGIEIGTIPMDAFTGDVQKVPAVIQKQFMEYEPHMSWLPNHFQKTFDSSDEAIAYLGYGDLYWPRWEYPETYVDLNVIGDASGKLSQITMEVDYKVEDVRIQTFAYLYTEHYTGEIEFSSLFPGYLEFTETAYTTRNGTNCLIVHSSPLESGYCTAAGYLVNGAVLYRIHLAYPSEDQAQAEELLYKWLEQF